MRTLGSSVWECVTVSDRTSGFTRRPSAAGDPGTLTWSSKSLPKAGRGARLRIPRKIKALPLLLAERATDRATERERKVQRYGRALNGTGGQRNGPRDPHPTKPPKPAAKSTEDFDAPPFTEPPFVDLRRLTLDSFVGVNHAPIRPAARRAPASDERPGHAGDLGAGLPHPGAFGGHYRGQAQCIRPVVVVPGRVVDRVAALRRPGHAQVMPWSRPGRAQVRSMTTPTP